MNRTQYLNLYRRLAKTRTRYTECIKISRKDGVVFRFTAHDKVLHIREKDNVNHPYTPIDSFTMTALENSIGLAVTNMDLNGIISDDSITDEDMKAGLFDNARFDIFIAYWSNTQIGTLPLRVAWVGEIALADTNYRVDLRGISQRLAQMFVQLTTIDCRYTFCDIDGDPKSKCGLSAGDYSTNYTINSVVNKQDLFTVPLAEPDKGKYAWGLCTFTSGNNNGLSMEILRNPGSTIQLFLPMPYAINSGDTVRLLEGCNKTFDSCIKFENHRRFGGEPYLTGSDMLTRYLKTFNASNESEENSSQVGLGSGGGFIPREEEP